MKTSRAQALLMVNKTNPLSSTMPLFPRSVSQTLRGKLAVLFLAAGLGSLPIASHAAQTVSGFGPDDWNTSTLIPDPPTFVGFGNAVAQCPWINSAMTAFDTAHPSWTYTWSTVSLQSRVSVSEYFPWVVTAPTINAPAPDGGIFIHADNQSADRGGAGFSMLYTPQNGDPVNIGFVSAYQEILYDTNSTTTNVRLDVTNNAPTPFYNNSYAGAVNRGTNHIGWMLDSPYDSEPGPATNQLAEAEGYHTDVEFQTVVAVDTGAGGGFAHNVVLYNGFWWGYQYTNVDVPEPSMMGLLCLGTFGLGLVQWRRKRT